VVAVSLGHIIKAYRWRFIYCKILWTKVIRNNAEKWISFSLCYLCSDRLETMLKMIIQNVNIIFKLVFPTNHVFDHTDRIVNCIDKSFWQKSLALTIRSFCIQLEAYSSNEIGEKWQNVFRRINASRLNPSTNWKSSFTKKLRLDHTVILHIIVKLYLNWERRKLTKRLTHFADQLSLKRMLIFKHGHLYFV
jgi:hypothetical protein